MMALPVLPGSCVDARINKSKIAILVFSEAIAAPGQGSRRQFLFEAVSPLRQARIVIEQVVPFQFEESLRDSKLTHFPHCVRHVIELRGVIDRAEKTGQIVEKSIVSAADIGLDRMPGWRLQLKAAIGIDNRSKIAARKIDKANICPIVLIDGDPHFRYS